MSNIFLKNGTVKPLRDHCFGSLGGHKKYYFKRYDKKRKVTEKNMSFNFTILD